MPDIERPEVNVAYDDTAWPVDLKPLTTIDEIRMWSLVNHGLPTPAHESFKLFNADGQELAPREFAQFVGVKPGDTLTLTYAPIARDEPERTLTGEARDG